ncbi:MAG: hypothetical protein ACI846_000139 [Pseudoalteromonas distincta]
MAIVLGVFLALAIVILYWAIKRYKSDCVRSYQRNELGIDDPIGHDLRKLAKQLAKIEDESELHGQKSVSHVQQSVKIKRDMVRLGREIIREEKSGVTFSDSSYEQKI